MAQETFVQLWNKVLLYAPNLPVPLAQQFVKNSYKDVIGAHYWNELYQDGEHTLPAEYSTGTAGVTEGSATVTLTGATSPGTTDWVGRQIGFLAPAGYAPFYTITAAEAGADPDITLDRVYEGPTDTGLTFLIAEYFVEFPSDLSVLDDIRDANNNWRLRRQFHQPNYLDRIDANRTHAGSPILYVSATPRVASGVAYPRYEFWPRIPGETKLVYRYVKSSELTTATSTPVTDVRPEVIIWGALAQAALWPGTPERPNPFFSLELHKEYKTLFEDGLQDSIISDLDKAQRLVTYAEDDRGYPADARFIQEHGLA